MKTLSLFGLLLLCACGPRVQGDAAGDTVTLRVEPATARSGSTVQLVLSNGSAGAVGYNLCSSGLERRTADVWQPVPSDRVCTMELRLLPPGEQVSYPIDLPPGLAAGEYRFVTNLEYQATATSGVVRSEGFRVG
jgi:hypothetical protein